MKKIRKFKIGDQVTIVKIPEDLDDSANIDTPGVFRRALGKTFPIIGFDKYGHLELEVAVRRPARSKYQSDTIWIEPEFVVLAKKGRAKK